LANSAAYSRSVGREVRYGNVIQLQHAQTATMLAVTRHAAHVSKEARRAMLEVEPAEAAWFRVMPRLRIHSEGERVRLGDPAVLEHVSTGLKLRVERSGKLPDGRREVAAAAEPSSVKINLYRAHEPPESAAVPGALAALQGGASMRLMHKEADGFLGCEMARALLGLPVLVVAEETHVLASCNTMWEVHKADCTDGSACHWSDAFRIVHTASGRSLTVSDQIDVHDAGEVEEWEKEDAPLQVVLAPPDAPDAVCLFEIVPQYQQRDPCVHLDDFFRLRHVATGRWLHYSAHASAPGRGNKVFGRAEVAEAGRGASASPRKLSPAPRTGRAMGSPRAESKWPLSVSVESGGEEGSSPAKRRPSLASRPPPSLPPTPLVTTGPGAAAAVSADSAGGSGGVVGGGGRSLEDLARSQIASSGGSGGGDGAALAAEGWVGRLVATVVSHDEDVFALQPVDEAQYADATRALAWRAPFCGFLAQFGGEPSADAGTPLSHDEVDFSALIAAVSEMILFVTRSDNPNPLTREGLPHAHRQLLLRELQMLDLALEAIAAPLRATFDSSEISASRAGFTPLGRAATLCMVLARHLLREHASNKSAALRFVPMLQEMLGLGIRTAGTLTEVFVDNEAQLLRVEEAHVAKFVSLIRSAGREGKYVSFLLALCECRGVAIRRNQWRIASALLLGAPELLPDLALDAAGQLTIAGDGAYFEGLSPSRPVELCRWLASCGEALADYVEKSLQLCAALATGRNLRNAPLLQKRLPYPLVLALLSSPALQRRRLGVCTAAAAVARCLYVDTEPHQLMARVKTVRIWANVSPAAESGALSSRLTTVLPIDWTFFDALKRFLVGFVAAYETQDARQIQANRMVLELLRLFQELLAAGFYKATEVASVLPMLLALLDGRADVVDGAEPTDAGGARYEPTRTVRLDTLVVMECKLTLCRVLQMLCDVRLDLRLSQLLAMYKDEWDRGIWLTPEGNASPKGEGLTLGLDAVGRAGGMLTTGLTPQGGTAGYARLSEEEGIDEAPSVGATRAAGRERAAGFEALWAILALDVGRFVPILMDLTFYRHPPLVSAALALLVRQFEQRQGLRAAAARTQLLAKPEMVRLYGTFDQLLRELGLLASRRNLFDDELYTAARLLGQLVCYCSEEVDEPGAENRSMGNRSAGVFSSSRTARSARTAAGSRHTSTDHTEGVYLLLIGKARAALGSATLTLTELRHTRPPQMGDRVQIEGGMYSVRSVEAPAEGSSQDSSATTLTLDRPLRLEKGAPTPDELRPGGSGEIWLMLLCYSAGYNLDMQVLLRNMGAHTLALKLLSLSVADEVLAAELKVRAVLRAAYRLIKAMVSGFAQLQAELVPAIPTFVAHVEANLVAYDISPTGTISATLRDNRAACAMVSVETIRHFVRLAAREHAPRFLRFLSLICAPAGVAIRRNQTRIMQALADKEAALVLFGSVAGRAERAKLVAAGDHVVNPRGRLAYHIELVGLLATLTKVKAPVVCWFSIVSLESFILGVHHPFIAPPPPAKPTLLIARQLRNLRPPTDPPFL